MEAVRVFLLLPGTLACLSLVNVVTPELLGAQAWPFSAPEIKAVLD